MNAMNGNPPALWQEARNGEGRVYYYNVQTKATQWAKPVELMGASERALANQPWKEYTAEGGRKYWYNTETKHSSWEMPDVYKNALAQVQPPPRPAAAAPTFVAGGTPAYTASREQSDYDRPPSDRRGGYGMSGPNGMPSAQAAGSQEEPDYSTFEEAEAAFMKLLRRNNVQADWTWEQVMRAVIKDPQYRALKDPKDRKAAFEKYVVEVQMQEKDRAKERFAKLRSDFGTMLRRHPEIKHYSRWKTIRPIIEGETIFRSTDDEDERRQLFDEYIIELKREHAEREADSRKAAKEDLADILKGLELEPYTRWSEAQAAIQSSEKVQADKKFEALTQSDILNAFENHVKSLERTFNDARQQQKASKARRERQNRDRFLQLIQELRKRGEIRAGSKWMDVVPSIEDDPRYKAMLGQAGSTPLDLFWDAVEEEERALRGPRNDVLDVLDDKRYELTLKTSFDEFNSVMRADRRTDRIDRDTLELIFNRLQEKVQRRAEEEKHAANRHQRRAIDLLRSRIKHLEPPVRASDAWEQVKARVEKTEEYRAVESEESRRTAFDKVIRRLKEKEEDAERERELREKDRASRRDNYDRYDRYDRDRRSGHVNSRSDKRASGRPSRSPEPDAYEADRRKAQADRERSYRKVSGLSPSPVPTQRGRDRDREKDRDRERDRERPSSRSYVRDRRDRDDEREKLYRSRADPRTSRDELDYGADTPRSTSRVITSERRRRRDSDTESVASRSAKRYRRDPRDSARDSDRASDRHPRDRERESAPRDVHLNYDSEMGADDKEKEKEKEAAVHSGSEEGEIEEE